MRDTKGVTLVVCYNFQQRKKKKEKEIEVPCNKMLPTADVSPNRIMKSIWKEKRSEVNKPPHKGRGSDTFSALPLISGVNAFAKYTNLRTKHHLIGVQQLYPPLCLSHEKHLTKWRICSPHVHIHTRMHSHTHTSAHADTHTRTRAQNTQTHTHALALVAFVEGS